MKRYAIAPLLIIASLIPCISSAQFEGMKYRIPSDANSLVLINAEKLFGSPVADRERWAARRKAAFESGISALPPDATEVLMAGRLDHEFGETVWEMSMVKLQGERNVSSVAQRFGGTMDTIDGRSAVRLPDDHYVVQIMSNLLGSYTPANRQDVTRWLKSTNTTSGSPLPEYLEQAFVYASKVGTPIVMALDLEGVVSPAKIKAGFGQFESLKASGISPDAFAKLMQGAKGVTLGITAGDDTLGAIRVDFSQSPEILGKVGKDLLIEVLQKQGVMIEDVHDWSPSINGNTFLLRGKLSSNGARRVMSVLALPPTLADSMNEAMSPGSDPEGTAKRIASQQYFQSITTLLDDLHEKPKRDHAQTFGQAAVWYDRYARKIDQLPILNVDEQLLDFGFQCSTALRNAEMAMKGVGMRSSVRTASNNPSVGASVSSYGGGYRGGYGYGGGYYGPSAPVVGVNSFNATMMEKGRSDAIIRGQERTAGAASVQQIWQAIDQATASIRRDMVQKYSADF
ncbi:hypothetical protein [Novipirellula artificiosorum]|uniref:Uncharacterized protein n=1 Tax=Novipirellula artificiosorum TaxID=2528016 RepID=A0A5C6DZ50_9BACT|nr:hypothetical protein [Novipirellula artificiosorum]TWU41928.1 hypothetical protein Poly41_02210 [Novipirellula artificiosorum]